VIGAFGDKWKVNDMLCLATLLCGFAEGLDMFLCTGYA
jgi:hypothetical protein